MKLGVTRPGAEPSRGEKQMDQDPNVILRGGPASHDDDHLYYAENPDEKLKILRGHRYDHFKRTSKTYVHNGRHVAIYSWSECTYVAE
jgi:hypothetical protein